MSRKSSTCTTGMPNSCFTIGVPTDCSSSIRSSNVRITFKKAGRSRLPWSSSWMLIAFLSMLRASGDFSTIGVTILKSSMRAAGGSVSLAVLSQSANFCENSFLSRVTSASVKPWFARKRSLALSRQRATTWRNSSKSNVALALRSHFCTMVLRMTSSQSWVYALFNFSSVALSFDIGSGHAPPSGATCRNASRKLRMSASVWSRTTFRNSACVMRARPPYSGFQSTLAVECCPSRCPIHRSAFGKLRVKSSPLP
mmetsp:Transcript_49467/g.150544  ORF Transcript_49467/g.150544 Transcript_49467/m.150544 type:complete len:255 (-) Transcript_49467:1310-2074(-)